MRNTYARLVYSPESTNRTLERPPQTPTTYICMSLHNPATSQPIPADPTRAPDQDPTRTAPHTIKAAKIAKFSCNFPTNVKGSNLSEIVAQI